MRSIVYTVLCRLGFAVLLLLLTACYGPQRRQMLALLDEADSLNRAYAQMPSDTLLRDAADFFDRHGTPNEQVRAHYLLGCAYRDMGEAPQALQCYLDAVDRADTLSNDCDFKLLARVHGQAGDLFAMETLYQNAKIEYREATRLALSGKDTLTSILAYGQLESCYFGIGDIDSALAINNRTRELLCENGYESIANSFLATSINILLEKRDYTTAREQIDKYEYSWEQNGQAALNDPKFKLLFYYKGLLNEGVGNQDSALFYYNRLVREGVTDNNLGLGYKGLLSVYERLGNRDSVIKYAKLFTDHLEMMANTIKQTKLQSIQGLYDYTRHQHIAEREMRKSEKLKFDLTLVLALLIVSALIGIVTIQQYRKKQREKQQEMKEKLNQHIDLYKQKMEELQQLKDLSEDYKEELALFKKMEGVQKAVLATIQQELSTAESDSSKYRKMYAQSRQDLAAVIADSEQKQKMLAKEIDELKTETSSLKKEIDELSMNTTTSAWIEKSKLFADTPIFTRIKYVAEHPLEQVQESEWDELTVVFSKYFPALYHDISQHQDKNKQLRCRICILTAMGIRNGEQACLLDKPKQTITNNMSALNRMLFGDDSSRTLYKNLVNGYNICL